MKTLNHKVAINLLCDLLTDYSYTSLISVDTGYFCTVGHDDDVEVVLDTGSLYDSEAEALTAAHERCDAIQADSDFEVEFTVMTYFKEALEIRRRIDVKDEDYTGPRVEAHVGEMLVGSGDTEEAALAQVRSAIRHRYIHPAIDEIFVVSAA